MSSAPPARPFPAVGVALLLTAGYVIWHLPYLPSMDGEVRYQSLNQFLTTGTFSDIRYSLYGPLASAPLWYLGRELGDEKGFALRLNRLLVLGCLPVLWGLFRPLLPPRERVRLLLAVAAGSMLPHYAMGYMGDEFTAVAAGVGLGAAALGSGWGWPLAVAGAANAPATIPALGLAAVVICWQTRQLRHLLAPVAAAGLMFAENYARRGHPLHAGYERDRNLFPNALPYSGLEGFCYPAAFGLLSVLFSFGKGLLFFAPAAFAPLPADPGGGADARVRAVQRVWLAYLAGLVLVYCRWWCWSGSWCWGPRFLLFAAFPAGLALARWGSRPPAHPAAAGLLAAAALLSGWVGGSGMVFHDYGLNSFMGDHGALDFAVFYVPECSALWWPFSYPDRVSPLSGDDYSRLGIGVAAGVYLAAPFLPPLAVWLVGRFRRLQTAARDGRRFRF